MNIAFQDFWESHRSDYFPYNQEDISKCFLEDVARQIQGAQKRKIAFTSVYGKKTTPRRLIAKLNLGTSDKLKRLYGKINSSDPIDDYFNIWYTAENIRPPLDEEFDSFLSFDLDGYDGRNLYLPLWLCRLGPTVEIANSNQKMLTQKRSLEPLRLKNFAVVASNPETIRMHFVSKLTEVSEVSVFGRMGKSISNKDQVLKNYNFNICFENDLYPGYVTEKAVEAYLSGCIPIWRGLDAGEFLNKNAMIDVTDLTINDAIEKVVEFSKDKISIQKMRQEPLLNKPIDLQKIVTHLQSQINAK